MIAYSPLPLLLAAPLFPEEPANSDISVHRCTRHKCTSIIHDIKHAVNRWIGRSRFKTISLSGPQVREENDLTNRRFIRKEHHQPIYA
jgi:hypothetical protein